MKTKADLERLAKTAGASLEEDLPWRDMRTFQIVAPDGMRWTDGSTTCLRVDWAKGSSQHSAKFNANAYLDASSRIACGLEPIPAADAYLYALD
jgi:hypothetical protein